MGSNRFLDPTAEALPERPRAVLARLDTIEEGEVFLEAVDRDWLIAALNRQRDENADILFLRAPISVIQLRAGDYVALGGAPEDLAAEDQDSGDGGRAEPAWLNLGLDAIVGTAGSATALYYPSLFAQGVPTSVRSDGEISAALISDLAERLSLDDYETTEAELFQALAIFRRDRVSVVGVYDVGQGGANALCDAHGMPLCYFDLGGGVLGHASTFPAAMTGFCDTAAPPVILSHWDWDHWSSGTRFGAPFVPWIVPNQSLGVVHRAFAAQLALSHGLMVWPSALTQLTVGQLTIVKCTGSGRNHSGLAAFVDGPSGEPPILLTGDARYTAVPNAAAARFTAVVAPHHGADMKSGATPGPGAHEAARVAYSYGKDNHFAHPRLITQQRHEAFGWKHACFGSHPPSDRHTTTKGASGLGHIGLTWTGLPAPTHPACGGTCSLGFTQ